ncbi:LysE family translocator [Desulfobacula toluolica]|uniref:LysE: lysine exporter protein n=1 Tax=Desulfobacula toluolica (strain DSM 7467 / Tol2) TaxID=651182 RepID=K0NEJ2_DESTT|nr:LysE family translocator [Desulfobacula toluolica]CCK79476.1 LysE: lysine exporter protein [Desulfobacula toluolica Tol2]
MSFNFIMMFSMTVFIASIIPGPSMLLALTHGIHYGAKKSMASAMGNVTITFIQASISIAGLGTILMASETAFQLIKWAGAAYLLYIGISILCSSEMSLSTKNLNRSTKKNSLTGMYLQAAFVTAGNPKAIVFFTAVFPQFIDPGMAYFYQFCVLMTICTFIAFSCFMIYAICGQKIVSLFSKDMVGKHIKRIIGSTFIGAAIGLAASNK